MPVSMWPLLACLEPEAAQAEVARVELGEGLEPGHVGNGQQVLARDDQTLDPQGLQDAVDVNLRDAERVRQVRLRQAELETVLARKAHRLQAHQHLAEVMGQALVGWAAV